MRAISSRLLLIITVAIACAIFAAELWRHDFTLLAPLWLLQVMLLCFAAWLMARENRERHATQAALRRSEERFTKIFYFSPAGIALSRQADGCFLEVNDTYARLTGYTRAELIGHTSSELGIFSAENRATLLALLQQKGSARGIDLQLVDKAGAAVDVYCGIELVEFNGESCLLSSIIDIGERKRMEEDLRRLNDELEDRVARRTAALEAAVADQERALRLKDEFLAMVSHELRTPLTGVLTMAEILAGEMSGPLSPRQQLYIRNIQKSGERLLEVVNSILSYTHLISGELQLVYEPCRLAYLLDVAATSLRVKAAEKQQAFTIAVDPPDLTVNSDPEALAQVVKRLLDNAIKFTPRSGAVGVLAQNGPEPATVEIVVWDTGIGLAAADLEGLVKPFTQADGSLSRQHEGIGMGLAYVNQMVLLLGGSLSLTSAPNAGSRFTITLPVQPAGGA